MNSEKSILRFTKVYNINSPEGLQNKRNEDATLSVGVLQGTENVGGGVIIDAVTEKKNDK